jgi:hypothetical protein
MAAQQSDDAEVDGPRPPLIKPGVYDFRFIDWSTRYLFGRRPKLMLRFKVITMGEYFDTITLCRHYNATRLIGKPGQYGRFKVGWHSNFLREYSTLFTNPTRPDRIAMTAFNKVVIVAKVITVTTGSDQRDIPESLQYSTISQLLKAKTDMTS